MRGGQPPFLPCPGAGGADEVLEPFDALEPEDDDVPRPASVLPPDAAAELEEPPPLVAPAFASLVLLWPGAGLDPLLVAPVEPPADEDPELLVTLVDPVDPPEAAAGEDDEEDVVPLDDDALEVVGLTFGLPDGEPPLVTVGRAAVAVEPAAGNPAPAEPAPPWFRGAVPAEPPVAAVTTLARRPERAGAELRAAAVPRRVTVACPGADGRSGASALAVARNPTIEADGPKSGEASGLDAGIGSSGFTPGPVGDAAATSSSRAIWLPSFTGHRSYPSECPTTFAARNSAAVAPPAAAAPATTELLPFFLSTRVPRMLPPLR